MADTRKNDIKTILRKNLCINHTSDSKVASSFIYLNGEATKLCVSLEMDYDCHLPLEKIIKYLEEDVNEYIDENIKYSQQKPSKKHTISANNEPLYEVPMYCNKDDYYEI